MLFTFEINLSTVMSRSSFASSDLKDDLPLSKRCYVKAIHPLFKVLVNLVLSNQTRSTKTVILFQLTIFVSLKEVAVYWSRISF